MRVLALVLVLANLAYFLWNVQRGDAGPLPSGPPSGESAADRLPGAARLRLLSEAPGLEEGGSRAPGSEAGVRMAAHCERIQVATDAAMAALLSALDAAGIDHRPLPGDGVTALRREQLYVPALASVAEARALVGELAAAGID
ncbi:MAG: hypothetical protein V2I63_07980, partial [Pseudomonadales bacterium]|nr:hypothetical protein [Pseudomonadales bacterium]